jgi:uncharacterized membrane protein (DUF2068 family)
MDVPPPPPGAAPGPRPRRRVDWELISCGIQGHELVGFDAASVRPEDSLLVREGEGLRWHRCLRCDSWVALAPPQAPARDHPPDRDAIVIPLRGKALRDRFVLRLIAVDRFFHFFVLGILGIAVLLFAAHESNLRGTFYRVMTGLQRGVGGGPVVSSGHVGILGFLDKIFSYSKGHLHLVGVALVAYAVLEGVEGVGLWLTKRWAEYLTFVATTVLLVPEVYELTNTVTPTKVITLLINLAVVAYLLIAKRLFGVRGGSRAEAAERERESGWAALEATFPTAQAPGPDGGEGVPAGAAR